MYNRVVVIEFWHGYIDYNYLSLNRQLLLIAITKVTSKYSLKLQKNNRVTNYIVITGQSRRELVQCVYPDKACSCPVKTCLNSTWSAECAESASIVIELIIGKYYPLQKITCLLFPHYKLQQFFEVKINDELQNYCV